MTCQPDYFFTIFCFKIIGLKLFRKSFKIVWKNREKKTKNQGKNSLNNRYKIDIKQALFL